MYLSFGHSAKIWVMFSFELGHEIQFFAFTMFLSYSVADVESLYASSSHMKNLILLMAFIFCTQSMLITICISHCFFSVREIYHINTCCVEYFGSKRKYPFFLWDVWICVLFMEALILLDISKDKHEKSQVFFLRIWFNNSLVSVLYRGTWLHVLKSKWPESINYLSITSRIFWNWQDLFCYIWIIFPYYHFLTNIKMAN